jgi:hypothetical protein
VLIRKQANSPSPFGEPGQVSPFGVVVGLLEAVEVVFVVGSVVEGVVFTDVLFLIDELVLTGLRATRCRFLGVGSGKHVVVVIVLLSCLSSVLVVVLFSYVVDVSVTASAVLVTVPVMTVSVEIVVIMTVVKV